MKITLNEWDGCFCLDFEAENLADAAMLVRLGRNGTKEVRAGNVSVQEKGVTGYITIGKRKGLTRAAFNIGDAR